MERYYTGKVAHSLWKVSCTPFLMEQTYLARFNSQTLSDISRKFLLTAVPNRKKYLPKIGYLFPIFFVENAFS